MDLASTTSYPTNPFLGASDLDAMASMTMKTGPDLHSLPIELWLQIADHLTPRNAVLLAMTNRRLYHCLIDHAYYRSVHHDRINMVALIWGIRHGALATVERALAQGQDPNQHVDQDYFLIQGHGLPLIEALDYPSMREPNLEIISLLLRYGADPYAICFQGNPIAISAMRGNRLCLKMFLTNEDGCRPVPRLASFRDQDGLTILHSAATSDRPEILEFLIEQGADINSRDTHGRTALTHAVHAGCCNNVAWLLEAGADPFVSAHNAWNLAEVAANRLGEVDSHGIRGDIFRLVTEAVYGNRSPRAWYHMTESQLHEVILRASSASALEALHALGADMDAKSEEGVTVLWEVCGYMYGSEEGAVDLAHALIIGGANVNFQSPKDGSTPLMQTIKAHSSEVFPLLLGREFDLDVTLPDHEGKTALEWAVELRRDTYAAEIQDFNISHMAVDHRDES